jgi:orotidine-5'-phosphate decarboxylase
VSDRLIVALDTADAGRAEALVAELGGAVRSFKVGSELFTAAGPRAVEMVHRKGGRVFLDLKFHDIPNTVAGAVRAAAGLGIWMANVHASGGRRMLEEAVRARDAAGSKMKLLGVTVLTSLADEDLREIGVAEKLGDQVLALAALARDAGLDGVVASPEEAPAIRHLGGPGFLIVTPGVRPAWAARHDQKRVATPREALARGADCVVVGRPITEAENPAEAARKVLMEIPA